MEKFKKLSKEEMKKVLGGDEMGLAPQSCSSECSTDSDCKGAQLCKLVGCAGDGTYYICY